MPNCYLQLFILFCAMFIAVDSAQSQNLDQNLRSLLTKHGMETPDRGDFHPREQVELGRALFFDRELSGNRDTSCATCHHPQLGSSDGLSLPVGTNPQEIGLLGHQRKLGSQSEFVPRNSPEIFNRGSSLWRVAFWDGRAEKLADGNFRNPAGNQLPAGLNSPFSIQAMFPVTSRDEMRGRVGDLTFEGEINELALVDDSDFTGIWNALMVRLGDIPEYRTLFEAAYPGVPFDNMTFANAAQALTAFEIAEFTFLDSPFDQYLQGDNSALTQNQKKGAQLFYGKANCASCHSGPLMTDQKFWSLATPQLGPGKGDAAPLDFGRFAVTGAEEDRFAFRTPPLRNIAATGPYMHDGAFTTLESVIRHHAFPTMSLWSYRAEDELEQIELVDQVISDPASKIWINSSIDRKNLPINLSKKEIALLVDFLGSLTAPNLPARLESMIPDEVPSGLPVETR